MLSDVEIDEPAVPRASTITVIADGAAVASHPGRDSWPMPANANTPPGELLCSSRWVVRAPGSIPDGCAPTGALTPDNGHSSAPAVLLS